MRACLLRQAADPAGQDAALGRQFADEMLDRYCADRKVQQLSARAAQDITADIALAMRRGGLPITQDTFRGVRDAVAARTAGVA